MRAMELLIKNALLLPLSSSPRKADMLLQDGKIALIEQGIEHRGAEVIDGEGCYLIPAFANTHTHIAMTLLRGFGEGLVLQEWLEKKIWPAEARLSEEDIYWGALLGVCELVRSGCTVFNEMYLLGLDEIAKAAEQVGINAVVGFGVLDFIPDSLKKAKTFAEKHLGQEHIKPSICCHAPYTCSPELIKEAKTLANKLGLLFHMHVSETRKELFDVLKRRGKRPVEYLYELGVMDERTLFAHMVFVSKREIVLCGKAGIAISHNPVSNMKLAGGGIAPILELNGEGALVTLGTDGAASNNGLSMLETLKVTALLQKHRYWDATALPAKLALKFATLNGWKALGFEAGDIREGMRAELVLLKRFPNLYPSHDHYANVVFSARDSNVKAVFSRGRPVFLDGKVLGVDEDLVKQEVEERAKEVVKGL